MSSVMFRSKSPVVKPLGDQREKSKIPGGDSMKFLHLVNLIRNGHGYFTKKRDRFKSTVFRVNIGVKGIAVCDRKGLEALFDLEKIYKEPTFGRLNYNLSLLDGYTPSIFTNGVEHEKKKAFLMKICELAQEADLLKTVKTIVPTYLQRWHKADAEIKANWEAEIMAMTSDILTVAFLGTRVDPADMQGMLKGTWTKNKGTLRRSLACAQKIKEQFTECPKLHGILELAREMGLSDKQAVMDILFMLNFNAYGGISGALRSCLAWLYNLDQRVRQDLEHEILQNTDRDDGITEETLKKMKLMDRFLLEVLRVSPPVPILFGRARKDFLLESDSGSVEVRTGELLIGNCYLVHRDPSVFHEPDEFMPSRFEDESLLHHIVFSNGPYREVATPKNHHCPAKEIIFMTLKAVLIQIMMCCDYTFTKRPYWTQKKLRRLGCPDNEMELSSFNYTPKTPFIKEQFLEVEDFDALKLVADINIGINVPLDCFKTLWYAGEASIEKFIVIVPICET